MTIESKLPMRLTPKQIEYIKHSNKTYNIKSGATRSGKTWLDYFVIPQRVIATKGNGAIVIFGNTKGTIQRNIIEPMQKQWPGAVSDISSNNTVRMFGKTVHALGADSVKHVERIRGMSIEYAYGDEVVSWNKEVFNMLHSRLDHDNSKFDGTCNPEDPEHWFKKGFLDNPEFASHTFHQHYELDDNIFLPDRVKDRIKDSYRGTVYWDRYILGRWTRAEGLIYQGFANNPDKFLVDVDDIPELKYVNVGVDFSNGGPSRHTFVAVGMPADYSNLYILASERLPQGTEIDELGKKYVDFIMRVEDTFRVRVDYTYADSAVPVFQHPMRVEQDKRGIRTSIRSSYKHNSGHVNGRIEATLLLMNEGRLFITEHADTVKSAFMESAWCAKSADKGIQKRLDDHSTDVDTLDAFEYGWSRQINRLMRHGGDV